MRATGGVKSSIVGIITGVIANEDILETIPIEIEYHIGAGRLRRQTLPAFVLGKTASVGIVYKQSHFARGIRVIVRGNELQAAIVPKPRNSAAIGSKSGEAGLVVD